MQLLNSSAGLGERATSVVLTALLFCGLAACTDSREPEVAVPSGPMISDAELKPLVTVSGVSAGGYLAVQAHIALAHRIGGVAALAGGPYYCANGSIRTALGPCISGEGIDVAALQAKTAEAAGAGAVAPLEAIADSSVWIYHSPADSVVNPRVSDALADYYAAYVPESRIRIEKDVPAAHGWPTQSSGRGCDDWGGDFINACDYDASGELLQHLYGNLSERGSAAPPRTMDMSVYFPSGSGVADQGYVFIPSGCAAANEGCRLHIALHGCKQGTEFIEDRFVTQVGLNEWAESNNIIVVYPQVEKSLMNPQGCWDWWGYTDENYANRNGPQIQGINKLIDAFAASNLLSE